MTIRRAARGLLALAIFLVTTFVAAPSGRAQGTTVPVTLRLVSQTPWNTLKDPVLEVAVLADNTGAEPIDDLTLGVTIGAPVRSRTAYETSLTSGPELPIFARTLPEKNALEPGGTRRFHISPVDLSTIGDVSRTDSLVYPMRIDLRSGGSQVAVLDTAVIFLVRDPEVPLLVSTTIELTAPTAFDPDGLLVDREFEGSLAPTGSLGAEVAAIGRLAEGQQLSPVDLVVQPSLLDQLSRMADGYQRIDGSEVTSGTDGAANAAALIAALRRMVASPSINVTAMPFSAPTIPSLLASGLSADLATQQAAGRETVKELLGVDPETTIVRPPEGALDDAAVSALAALGASTILGNADTVERPPQPNEFTPPPTATLAVGGQTIDLVLPDTATQTLLSQTGFLDDPVRAAQATLGELATIWREQPVPAAPRGIGLLLSAGYPARFWGALLGRLMPAPFLRPVAATDLVEKIPPPAAPSAIVSPSTERFTPTYVEEIKHARRDLLAFRSMLVTPTPIPDRLGRGLLYAGSAEYLGNESAGRAWIDHVSQVTHDVFSRAVPDTSQDFTFLSETASIPLRMGDPGNLPIRFTLQLRSSQFRFPDGAQQVVTLTQPDQIVTFDATALASGKGTIEVVVRAPTGRAIRQTKLFVDSRSVNRIALLVTGAAALVLVGLWSRRLFKRPTT
ncbi:MAG: hypothetical protein ABI595_01510 [Actinomycetota bacterium]